MLKTSARRGMKMLRDLYQKGHLQEAKALEQHLPQMMANRASPYSQLRILGAGGEGVAQHVATPGARGAVQHAADPLARRVPGGFASRTNPWPEAHDAQQHIDFKNPNVAPGTYALKTFDTTADVYNPIVQDLRRQSIGHEHPLIATTHAMGQTPATHAGRQHEYALNEFVPTVQPKTTPQSQLPLSPRLRQRQRVQQQRQRQQQERRNQFREEEIIDQVRHAFPGQTQLDLRGNIVGGKVIDRIPVPTRDLNPNTMGVPSLEKVISQQLEFDSPTERAMNYARPDAPHSLRETMLRRADTQGALRADAPLSRPGLTPEARQLLNKQMRGAERAYSGQLLHEAYGRPSARRPAIELTRPAQGAGLIQDAPPPAPSANPYGWAASPAAQAHQPSMLVSPEQAKDWGWATTRAERPTRP
jgi:hypothetical protein